MTNYVDDEAGLPGRELRALLEAWGDRVVWRGSHAGVIVGRPGTEPWRASEDRVHIEPESLEFRGAGHEPEVIYHLTLSSGGIRSSEARCRGRLLQPNVDAYVCALVGGEPPVRQVEGT